jgi:hypothetical protein
VFKLSFLKEKSFLLIQAENDSRKVFFSVWSSDRRWKFFVKIDQKGGVHGLTGMTFMEILCVYVCVCESLIFRNGCFKDYIEFKN